MLHKVTLTGKHGRVFGALDVPEDCGVVHWGGGYFVADPEHPGCFAETSVYHTNRQLAAQATAMRELKHGGRDYSRDLPEKEDNSRG